MSFEAQSKKAEKTSGREQYIHKSGGGKKEDSFYWNPDLFTKPKFINTQPNTKRNGKINP